MASFLHFVTLGLEGQWHGAAAVALVAMGVVIFIGTIYVLLSAIYGWLQGYLVTMVALMTFSIILSGVWLIGIPGTIPGTGPRGTEPYWVVFLPDSEQGQEFAKDIKQYPSSGFTSTDEWRAPAGDEVYPGNISAQGEVDNVKRALEPALAAYFQKQKTGSSDPLKYDFRVSDNRDPKTLTQDEQKLPVARVFFKANGDVRKIESQSKKVLATYAVKDPASRLLVGIDYPEVRDPKDGSIIHPAIRVFGYRNKGRVFQASFEWMVISILLFALHILGLARYEKRQKRREVELAAGAAPPRQPVKV